VALGFDRSAPVGESRRFHGLGATGLPGGVAASNWGSLLHAGALPPWCPEVGAGGTLGEHARVEADFRDEYYALRGHVQEGGEGLRVITSGHIETGRLAWGERTARIHRQTWREPTVASIHLHPRQARRTGPRLLVATQTRVIEAAADFEGRCVGLTPVLTVLPESLDPLDALAILLSPPASAWARGQGTGAGMSLRAMKLSASDLRALPLPGAVPGEARRLAGRVVAGELDQLGPLAATMNAAWGAPPALLQWWCEQAGVPMPDTH
jgi:hypothetical protein